MPERNTDPLVKARKKYAEDKFNTLKTCLDDMLFANVPITVTEVIKLSGLSKSYLYQNEQAKKLLKEKQEISKKRQRYSGIKYDSIRNYQPTPKDAFLQIEELKRKLHDSYMVQCQILGAENERLKIEIEDIKKRIEQAKEELAAKEKGSNE
ncbi:MAG TPA: hypothetical protein IAA26_09545 [Candidatus Blautia faecipullorum]|nr:hypothetical protein [Candidatus Blautia faecipullorum]